jgi:hypothetical protein
MHEASLGKGPHESADGQSPRAQNSKKFADSPSFLDPNIFHFEFRVISRNFEFIVRKSRAQKNGVGRLVRTCSLVRKV